MGNFEEHPLKGDTSNKYHNRLQRYKTTSIVNTNDFHTFNLLYDESNNYEPTLYPSPRSVTDHVIGLDRDDDPPQRIIAHYMPPHPPFIARMTNGEIEFTEVPRNSRSFEAYLDNLRWGLEEVSLLLKNVDRENVIITADHGWAFCLYPARNSHLPGMIAPDVRQVPWVETSATDDQTYEPELSGEGERESMPAEGTLEALGYLG